MSESPCIAIIVAGGIGKRLRAAEPKQFVPVAGRPLVAHTLQRFQECPAVDEITLVLPRDRIDESKARLEPFLPAKTREVVAGGDTRQASVSEGLRRIDGERAPLVAVHDGARPLADPLLIERVIRAARECGGAIAAVPVVETLKEVEDEIVQRTVERSRFYRAQTPQCFYFEVLKRAFDRASEEGFIGTDEAALVERTGAPVRIVPGSERNIKVTTPDDMKLVEFYLGGS